MPRLSFPLLFLLCLVLPLAGCEAPPESAGAGTGPAVGRYVLGKPYQIDGAWFYPAQDWSYDETGLAGWHEAPLRGNLTDNGEGFDPAGLTAAHHTLPLPSVVAVTNLANGRSVQLRINDRGPFAPNEIIDVSRHAAELLGFEGQSSAKVRVKILVPESVAAASAARRNGSDDDKGGIADVPKAAPRDKVEAQELPPVAGVRVAPPPVASRQAPAPIPLAAAAPPPAPLAQAAPPPAPPASIHPAAAPATLAAIPSAPPPRVAATPPGAQQIYVQAGAFASRENALRLKSRLDPLGTVNVSGVR